MSLLDWIDIEKLNWDCLSSNPAAIHLLEQNPDKINWDCLSSNSAAISLLEQNQDKIHWKNLSKNPAAISLLEQNQDKIKWDYLSQNPAAIHLLEQNPYKNIYWICLCNNEKATNLLIMKLVEANETNTRNDMIDAIWDIINCRSDAIHFLEANPEKFIWSNLSLNPAAMHLLEQNQHKIDWQKLSQNRNPTAISLLQKNPDKIQWYYLSANPAALPLLKQYPDKINWETVFYNKNPQVFDFLLEETQFPDIDYSFYSFFCHICQIPMKPISLFEKNINKHRMYLNNSYVLSKNPAAIRIIEQCIDTTDWKEPQNIINWDFLSRNPAIFKPVEDFVLK